jgi:hypothetical protein
MSKLLYVFGNDKMAAKSSARFENTYPGSKQIPSTNDEAK